MICLSTTQGSPEATVAAIEENSRWIDLVELRLDFWDLSEETLRRGAALFGPDAPARAAAPGRDHRSLPRIVTVRRTVDGGRFNGSEAERAAALQRALELLRPEQVDLEDDFCETATGGTLLDSARGAGISVIRSVHEFGGTPDDLSQRIEALESREGDLFKYAVRCEGSGDLLRLYRAAQAAGIRNSGVERLLLGMGRYGVPSRLLPRRFGSRWTYASVPTEKTISAAPGQFTPRELVERFAYREAAAGAPLFAVLGDPVLHSGSPSFHNERFRAAGVDAAYVAFPADDLDAAMELFDAFEIRGVSVTIPHKEGVFSYLSDREPAVTALGACNTLLRRTDGSWRGRNTDVPGFLAPLEARFPGLSGRSALVIGAGGAARAVVFALLRAGVGLTVANRTVERGERLVAELNGSAEVDSSSITVRRLDDPELREQPFELIVQTTNVGMDGISEPIPDLPFASGQLVYDIIYTPPETPLIRRALAAGATTVTGDLMFRAQAEEQFHSFLELAIGNE
mgnify:CR=1 FL=1